MSSDIRMLGSCLAARDLVSAALIFQTASHTHNKRQPTPPSQPQRIAACHDVNSDAITPATTPIDAVTATRTPEDVARARSRTDIPRLTIEADVTGARN
jgi:hypothetical protein